MQSTGSYSQGWEVFGPPKGTQRPLHLPQQSQESLRCSATGTGNKEMGAARLPPAHSSDWEQHPSTPGRSGVPHCQQGDARSPQVCPASLNCPRAKWPVVPARRRLAPHAAVLCHTQISHCCPHATRAGSLQPVPQTAADQVAEHAGLAGKTPALLPKGKRQPGATECHSSCASQSLCPGDPL